MAKRKKRRLNYKRVFIALIALVLIIYGLVFLIKSMFNSKFKVAIKDKYVIANEDGIININFKATYKKKDVTSKVEIGEISSNGDDYEVTFIYKNNNRTYKRKKDVQIKDSIGPVITLNKGTVILKLNEKYEEPGYTAIDNLDKDITSKVKINNMVDNTKLGEYDVVYTVTDSSGNENSIKRKVKVVSNSPVEASLKDFSLEGYFEGTILKETEDMGESYANSFIYSGDSTFIYYKSYYNVNLWKKNGVTSERMLTATLDVNYVESGKTLVELFEEKKPEKVIIALGENSVATEEKDFFISNYRTLLENLKEASPDTIIVVQSILPVPKQTSLKGSLTNEKINKYNYYLAELCEEMGVYFLNSAEALKDSEGHLKSGYEKANDINHIGKNGAAVIHNYVRTHGIK